MKQAHLGLSVEQLNDRQTWLQEQVSTLLHDLKLMDILRVAGQPKLVGSAEMGLMVWPDIDLEVVSPGVPDLSRALDVVNRLMLEAGMRKLYIVDDRRSTKPDIPKGIYIGPDVRHGDLRWQVDIWIVNIDEARRRRQLTERIRSKLNDASHSTILQIKQVVAASDKYHRGISSVDIYTAVLDQGVLDMAGFDAYLRQTGRTL
ncbi:MAG: hypothetical protein ACR2OE_03830 [Thermomicrobiales bacterium]